MWKTILKAEELEKEGKIAPLKNLKGKPVFVYSAANDPMMLPWHQKMQADFFKHYEADVQYTVGQKERHWLAPAVPRKLEEHLYGKLKPSSSNWADTGVIVKFDQEEFVDEGEW